MYGGWGGERGERGLQSFDREVKGKETNGDMRWQYFKLDLQELGWRHGFE